MSLESTCRSSWLLSALLTYVALVWVRALLDQHRLLLLGLKLDVLIDGATTCLEERILTTLVTGAAAKETGLCSRSVERATRSLVYESLEVETRGLMRTWLVKKDFICYVGVVGRRPPVVV